MTLEADASQEIQPLTCITDPALREDELHSEVISADSGLYFSTPLHTNSKKCAIPGVDPEEDALGYKSFFTVECDDIVNRLQSKETQGWSVGKRKLEELDISTIEAEPVPFYCTPKSVLNDTTCSAKRRKICNLDHRGNLELNSYSTQYNNSLEKSVQKLHSFWGDGGMNKVQGKSNPLLNSLTAPKRSLFQKTIKPQLSQSNSSALTGKAQCGGNGTQNCLCTPKACNAKSKQKLTRVMGIGSSVSKEWKTGVHLPHVQHRINRKNVTHGHRSPVQAFEYRSFFAAECDKIYNQLKIHDIGRMMLADVSTIEAEPPPVLSTTINSILKMELENTQTNKKSALGISQLDLEKMNINYSVTERAFPLQIEPDHVLCSSNRIGQMEKVTITNTTQDIVTMLGERSVKDAIKDIVTIHGNRSVTDVTQDITTMHNKVPVVDSTQDIVAICDEESVVDATQDILAMCNEMPVSEAKDTKWAMCNKVSVADATQDIGAVCGDVFLADATQDIVVNVEPVPQKLVVLQGEILVPKNIHEVINIANSTQDISIHTKPRVTAQSHFSFQGRGTIFNAKKYVVHTYSAPTLSCINPVTVDTHLRDVTSMQHRSNSTNDHRDVLSIPNELTTAHVTNKTFIHCQITAPNGTQDILLKNSKETTTNSVEDTTTMYSNMATANITQDIITNSEKTRADATQTLASMYNEITEISLLPDTGDSTKAIAANRTLLNILPQSVNNQTYEYENSCRQMWPVVDLAHSSPVKGNGLYSQDSTCDLDLTDFAHDESVLCTRFRTLITSTPLPGIGNPLFIKKVRGDSVQQKPSTFLNSVQEEQTNQVTLQQKGTVPPMLFTGQSTSGRISKGLRLPLSSRSNLPKALEVSKLPQPACGIPVPCSTLVLNPVLKTPGMATTVTSTKLNLGFGRTNIPPMALTSLPRKNVGYVQQCKSRVSNLNLRQQTSENCLKTGKGFVEKDGVGVFNMPTVSFLRPPFQRCTPNNGIFTRKAQNIPGAQSASCDYKVSSLHPPPTAGFVASELVGPEQTSICPIQPKGSLKIFSKTKSRLSGLPIRKPQGAPIKHDNKGMN